jgi:hypothetical protein
MTFAKTSLDPVTIVPAAAGYVFVSNGVGELPSWQNYTLGNIHGQNTDVGTNQTSFVIDRLASTPKIALASNTGTGNFTHFIKNQTQTYAADMITLLPAVAGTLCNNTGTPYSSFTLNNTTTAQNKFIIQADDTGSAAGEIYTLKAPMIVGSNFTAHLPNRLGSDTSSTLTWNTGTPLTSWKIGATGAGLALEYANDSGTPKLNIRPFALGTSFSNLELNRLYADNIKIATSTFGGFFKSSIADTIDVMALDGTTFGTLKAKTVLLTQAPTADLHAATKLYVDSLIGGVGGAMVFKGTVGTGGTIELAALDALVIYTAGWVYTVITASSDLKGKVVEVGDTITCIVSRNTTSAADSDWVVTQANVNGAVISSTLGTTAGQIVTTTATGQTITTGTTLLSAVALTANVVLKSDYTVDNAVLVGTGAGTYSGVTLGAYTVLGNDNTNVVAMPEGSGAEVNTGSVRTRYLSPYSMGQSNYVKFNATAPTDLRIAVFEGVTGKIIKDGGYTIADILGATTQISWATTPTLPTSAGTTGHVAKDDNYFYICILGGALGSAKWVRTAMGKWTV